MQIYFLLANRYMIIHLADIHYIVMSMRTSIKREKTLG